MRTVSKDKLNISIQETDIEVLYIIFIIIPVANLTLTKAPNYMGTY